MTADATSSTHSFLAGGGEMGALTRAFDWSTTDLGSPDRWPLSLRTLVSMLLQARSPMFLWWGPDLIQFYNDAYRPSLGDPSKHPTALGQRGQDCWPEIWPIIAPLIDRVLTGGGATWSNDQLIPIDRNGHLEDVYWSFGYSPVHDDEGGIAGVLVTCQETTRQVMAQRQLTFSEDRFQRFIEQAPVAVALFSGPHFVITLANERVLEYWGRSREQVINKPLFDALPEAGGQGFEELLQGVFTTGDRFVAKELTVSLARNGRMEPTYIDFVYEPFYDQNDRITGVLVVCTEITEQVVARQQLRDEQNRLNTILAEVPVGILIANSQGELIYGNQQVEQIFRHPFRESQDIEAYKNWQLFDPATGEPFPLETMPMVRTLLHGETVVGVEMKLKRGDNTWGYASVNSVPVHDSDGRLLYGVAAFVDTTERKRAEEALQEADRRKDEFLATLAHELRNPLAPVSNTLQILRLTAPQDEIIAPAVALMSRQINHLVRLVDDLLDVSRINQGKLQLRLERLEVGLLIRQVVEATRPQYEAGGRTLSVDLPADPLYLQGDSTRLAQIVTNLLNNAAKFTREGGQVRLSVEQAGADVHIRVSDDGIGIRTDQLEAIFGLFAQSDNSLERSNTGLGLGLTLVRQLVSLHGGRVSAFSGGLQQGSEFRVSLPRLVESAEARQAPAAQPISTPGGSGLILVIDDNPDAAMTLCMLLKLKGYAVHSCLDGLSGVAAAENLRPSAILLDIGMPGLNGYDTCRMVRQQPWGQTMKVIALTGYGQEEDKRLSREAGFDAHLTKPVDLDALLTLLNALT